jgi:hypothetical protein
MIIRILIFILTIATLAVLVAIIFGGHAHAMSQNPFSGARSMHITMTKQHHHWPTHHHPVRR